VIAYILSHCVSTELCSPGNLVHTVKPDGGKGPQYLRDLHIRLKLPIERWRRHDNPFFKTVSKHRIEAISNHRLGQVWAGPDTLAAVNAALLNNHCPALSDPDGLGWTAFDAVGAALAFLFVQRY